MNYIEKEQKINDEIKENVVNFYKNNSEVCDRRYYELTSGSNFNIYEDVKNSEIINSLLLKSSIVILTANDFEKNTLHLNAYKEKKQNIKHVLINCSKNIHRPFNVNMYFFEIKGYFVFHMHAKETGSYTLGGAADLIRYALRHEYCFPTAIISFGICFGNDYKKQKIGDTIIVKKLYPYFMSAKIKGKIFSVKDSNIFDIDTELDAKIQHLKGKGEFNESNGIYYGNMITGEAVVSNALLKDIFAEAATNQPILGGEMEGYALFKECQGYESSIPCLLVKSICDWGACKNIDEDCEISNLKDKLQAYAAEQAYQVLKVFMREESEIFGKTIYEQIKEYIKYSLSKEKVVTPELVEDFLRELLENELKNNTVILEKCEKNKKLSLEILKELSKDGCVKEIEKLVFEIKM